MRIVEAQALAKTLAEEFDREYKEMKKESTASLYFVSVFH